MSEEVTYYDDYCLDCKVPCKVNDPEHKQHDRLSKHPPTLGVSVSENVNAKDKAG